MNDDDFLLDEDDDGLYYGPPDEELEEEEEEDGGYGDSDEEEESSHRKSVYSGVLSDIEINLLERYDNIKKVKKEQDPVSNAIINVVSSNPIHTSTLTVSNVVSEIMHTQGHSRLRGTQYQQGPLFGDDVRLVSDIEDDEANAKFNEELTLETRRMIDAFVSYLVCRDLSKDSVVSRHKKQRHLPAFIIYMFTVGAYEFIVDCPSMPQVYKDQISFAIKKLNQAKYDVLEELAQKYEEVGRGEVAKKVREMGLTWFYKQPAEVKTAKEFAYLDLTEDDIDIYREYRPKFTNVSSAITQEMISDYIEVAINEKKGIFEKLKDKTRGEAIIEVKKVFRKWSERYNPENKSLIDKLIFKD